MKRNSAAGLRAALPACMALTLGTRVSAQTGGPYDLTRNTIDGGGATFSAAGVYRVGGTIGQPAAEADRRAGADHDEAAR